MTLSSVRSGDTIIISDIFDKCAEIKAIRFGIQRGARVRCIYNTRRGPIILGKENQEIALGRGLAEKILVTRERG